MNLFDYKDGNTIVVPVPDTGKAAADGMAYELGIPSVEGLMRNRYVGRTFIEAANRAERVRLKFTPLKEVLAGKRVILVEDSIVRSTTLANLLSFVKEQGGAKEVHVRVACPPIVAPCFYGIDMSTVKELFAPKYMAGASRPWTSRPGWPATWGRTAWRTCRWTRWPGASTSRRAGSAGRA